MGGKQHPLLYTSLSRAGRQGGKVKAVCSQECSAATVVLHCTRRVEGRGKESRCSSPSSEKNRGLGSLLSFLGGWWSAMYASSLRPGEGGREPGRREGGDHCKYDFFSLPSFARQWNFFLFPRPPFFYAKYDHRGKFGRKERKKKKCKQNSQLGGGGRRKRRRRS